MREIDGAGELGLYAGWTWIGSPDPRHRFSVSGQFLADASSVHEGSVADVSVKYWQPISRPLTLMFGATVTYGSDSYSQTYFGVDASDSAASGLPVFGAKAGIRDFAVTSMLLMSFSPSWHLAGGVVYSRLQEDAADSPVVDIRGSQDRFVAGLGLTYAW